MGEVNRTLIPLAIASGSIVLGLLVHLALRLAVMHRHSQDPITIRGVPLRLDLLSGPARSAIPAVFLLAAIPFARFPPAVLLVINHLAEVWFLCSIGYLGVSLLAMAREMIMSGYQIGASDNLRARKIYTQIRGFEHIMIFLIVLLTVAVILMSFERIRELGVSILASAGLAGLVIGFSAQRSLGTLLA
ncbi:MAG TPA: hypothetical protein VJX67_16670, partial [Blastocatellia bacterium]|nr:hypothetical protein [Blastocatellia bacterium]